MAGAIDTQNKRGSIWHRWDPHIGLIFPNVELRLSIETSKASAVNIHLLFSPEDSDHVEQIKRFLLELDFSYQGGPYRCQRSDLIRLGRAHQPSLTNDEAARSEGVNLRPQTCDTSGTQRVAPSCAPRNPGCIDDIITFHGTSVAEFEPGRTD